MTTVATMGSSLRQGSGEGESADMAGLAYSLNRSCGTINERRAKQREVRLASDHKALHKGHLRKNSEHVLRLISQAQAGEVQFACCRATARISLHLRNEKTGSLGAIKLPVRRTS